MIKILLGGSPCTFWSIAQKNNRETEAEGLGWELFKNYLIAKEKFKPDFFLYENNKSAAQAIKDQIAKELGTDLMYINSSLVSAQNRQRFYVFNWEVEQPEDRGILLRDVLETGEDLTARQKSFALTTRCAGAIPSDTLKRNRHTMVAEPVRIPEYGDETKSRPVTASYAYKGAGEGSLISEAFPENPNKQVRDYIAVPINTTEGGDKARTLMAGYYKYGLATLITNKGFTGGTTAVAEKPIRVGIMPQSNGEAKDSQANRIYSIDGKGVTQSANGGGWGAKTGLYAVPEATQTGTNEKTLYPVKDGMITIKGKQYPVKLVDGEYCIRKLTPVECERLQTMPDGYTEGVSASQRYKALGNGWTAEVIIHILQGALKDVPKDEEIVVLSMYDGIATGRYCLDKMGFTNVKYFAYEIDKYAKEIAMKNYPDIIQMGDAFQLRHPDWTIGY